jgi:hypothetical protein
MQIKIEIDVRPDELRSFLGLPDVSGLQEDIIDFVRDKFGAAAGFDASQFVKSNFDTLRKTPAWKRFATRLGLAEQPDMGEDADADEPDADGPDASDSADQPHKRRRRRRRGHAQPGDDSTP